MLSIYENIKNLPDVLQDKIYQYYWTYIYSNVLNEITDTILLDKQINNFIDRYGNNVIKKHNNFYYRKFNKLIKENITYDKAKMLLCKYNNLNLKYCDENYIYNICSSINSDYQYIAPILICRSNELRYQVFHYLKSL